MAVLRYKGEDTDFEDKCVGFIIHRRYILTAAQCLSHKTGIKVDHVILGEHDKNTNIYCNVFRGPGGEEIERECADPVQRYEVESFVYHPNYNNPQYTNDIGLIRLATELSWEYNIQPICLPVTPQLRVRLFKEFIVTGWGLNELYQPHQVLQEAVLPLVSNADCQQRSSIDLTEKQLCTGGGHRAETGFGDGGGPLGYATNYNGAMRFVQFGVVSLRVETRDGKDRYTIFTRVASYMDWIVENIVP